MKHAAKRKIGTTEVEITRLGYGGTALAGTTGPSDEPEAVAVIRAALSHGIRYFDTSPLYGSGLSEHRMGAGLRHAPRAEIVVSTKVGRLLIPDASAAGGGALPFRPDFDYSRGGSIRSFEDSLQRMGVDRIDLLFIHDISHRWHGSGFEAALARATAEALPALVEFRDAGVIGAIGLGTNDLAAAVPMAAHGGLDCVMIAREYNLLNHAELLRHLAPVCVRNGVSLICAAPYASGILATGLTEGATYMYAPPDDAVRAKITNLEAVCALHGVPLRAAALQFADLNPLVSSVVAGLRTEAEIDAAIEAFNYPVPPAFWAQLKAEGLIDPAAPIEAGSLGTTGGAERRNPAA
ncbi:aldo/keto reductase [Bauldia sp.]|uniref:aldo/keto reductase n=1 Tax=Bauldia sp. TaxID=2575872 RepID=UPI003BAC5D07